MNKKGLIAAAAAFVVFTTGLGFTYVPSAEAGFSIPKIGDIVKQKGNGTPPTSAVSNAFSVKITVTDIRSGAPLSGCTVYELTTNKTPSKSYSGDTCYLGTAGKKIGVTDADGSFKTNGYTNPVRLAVLIPGADIFIDYFANTKPVIDWKLVNQKYHPDIQNIVFQDGSL